MRDATPKPRKRKKTPATAPRLPPAQPAVPRHDQGRTHKRERWEGHKGREQERRREQSQFGRDIGPIPEVTNPLRRAAAEGSLRVYCETYGAPVFTLAWSEDQLLCIGRMEQAILKGGLFAFAMPRGTGKTVLCEWAVHWALLNGHRLFGTLIGATTEDAEERLDNIRNELYDNDLLLEDYPEVCYPIRALGDIVARAKGQLSEGQQTHIEWGAKQIVLPTIPGARASGAIVKIAGITGRIRGMQYKRRDGTSVRPDFVVVDDGQTDESAKSLSQCRHRESVLAGAILGLAGPGKEMSGFVPCTVIQPDDMADRILDPKRHPEWNGVRTRMVKAWPAQTELWDRYFDLRKEGQRCGDKDGTKAREFYAANRAAMDEGAVVGWPARKLPIDLSGLQHAMNILCDRGREVFFAEYQNEPIPREDATRSELKIEDIMQRLNGVGRGKVPSWATRLTAFVDVQDACLWWMVCAWGDDFSGAAIDYGAWPEQGRAYFTGREVKRTLAKAHPQAAGPEGRWYAGLDALAEHILAREWMREDGAPARIGQLLVDANWGKSTDTVKRWCRETSHAAVVLPSHGKYVGASSMPFSEYKRRPGERLGLNWIVRKGSRTVVRHVGWDTNWWKSFMVTRLTAAKGDRGAFMLFGRDSEAHRMLAEQLTAERAVPVEAKGRQVDEFKEIPGRDNHLFDCLVGSAVAASLLGTALSVGTGVAQQGSSGRRKIKMSEWKRGKRGI